MQRAHAGTMESNDCLITVEHAKGTTINIESVVYKQFGQQIKRVIMETLKAENIENIHIHCQDKGALDYTIRARLLTAIQRLGEDHA